MARGKKNMKQLAEKSAASDDPFAAHPTSPAVKLPEGIDTSFSDSQTDEEGLEFSGASNGSRLSLNLSDVINDFGTLLTPQDPLSDYKETLSGYTRRVFEAIEAEQESDYMQHVAVFKLEREQLQAQGKLLTDLKLEVEPDSLGDIITVTSADGGRLPPHHQFKKRQTVTILRPIGEEADTAAPSRALETAAVTEASEEPTMNPARGLPEHSSKVQDWLNDPSRPHQQHTEVGDETLAARLAMLGFTKGFTATITNANEKKIVIQTRRSRIYEIVEQDEVFWGMIEGLEDVTYRRQKMALGCLPKLTSSSSNDESAAPDSATKIVSPDELRVRKVLLAVQECIDAKMARDWEKKDQVSRKAQGFAAQAVSWMQATACFYGSKGPSPMDEVISVLEDHPGLNSSQLGILKEAMGRTVTLLQGPPGTGKSRSMAAGITSMCRVFCDNRGQSQDLAAMGFELPTRTPVEDWGHHAVCKWLDSWKVLEGHQAAPADDGPDSSSEWPGTVTVTQEAKDVAHMTLKTLSGLQLMQWDLEDMQYHVKKAVNKEMAGMGAEMSSRHAETLIQMIDRLRTAMANDSKINNISRILDRDQRILACADSNKAVDNILSLLHNDKDFMAQGYAVIRLGSGTSVDDPELKNYCIDEKVREHKVTRVYQKMMEVVQDSKRARGALQKVTKELEGELKAMQASLKQEAAQELSGCRRKQLNELADIVIESITGQVARLVDEFLRSKPQSEAKRGALRSLQNVLRGDLSRLAKYMLLIRAQVVLGTNIAAGELRSTCDLLEISFPIVFLDEGGQSTEASSLVPLTLGAEWLLMGADLKQLPPTIRSDVGKRNFNYYGMSGGSMYGRLVHDLSIKQHVLHVQYRMHPKIREFVGNAWYSDIYPGLQEPSGRDMAAERPLPLPRGDSSYYRWPSLVAPIAFYDLADGAEQKSTNSHSYHNLREASVCVRLALIFATDPTVESLVILTPYKAQANMISNKLKSAEAVLRGLQKKGKYHLKHFDAYSIDSYQGQEADVVIFSPVRSNGDARTIGHTADYRRLNVAVSRAKRALVVAGSAKTLTNQSKVSLDKGGETVKNFWPDLVQWMKDNGAFVEHSHVEPSLHGRVLLPPELDFTEEDADARIRLNRIQDWIPPEILSRMA